MLHVHKARIIASRHQRRAFARRSVLRRVLRAAHRATRCTLRTVCYVLPMLLPRGRSVLYRTS